MKNLLLACLIFLSINTLHAQEDKYIKAMEKNLSLLDTSSDISSYLTAANNFERIAKAEKDKWLPYYYTSFCYSIASFMDTVKERKDIQLDKADEFILIADSLQPDNSEIYTLKGMIAQGRLSISPMDRWQKYGPISNANFDKAKQLDPSNPRPYYLISQSVYFTPVQFGGGPEAAKPIIEEAVAKYKTFVPADPISPNWGAKMAEQLLESVNKEAVKK